MLKVSHYLELLKLRFLRGVAQKEIGNRQPFAVFLDQQAMLAQLTVPGSVPTTSYSLLPFGLGGCGFRWDRWYLVFGIWMSFYGSVFVLQIDGIWCLPAYRFLV